MLWDTLRYAHDKPNLCLDCLFDAGCCDRWWHEYGGGISSGLFHCIGHIREHRLAEMLCAGFLWIRAADDVCAVFYRLLRMKGAL